MWLITSVGFFSVVQKASDLTGDTLTVRARVRGDLEALRAQYLPSLSDVQESKTNDYRFRAVAPRADVAAAMADMVNQLQYSNFKNQVAKKQGSARSNLYHDVWDVLYRLQTEPKKYAGAAIAPIATTVYLHPHKDDKGRAVEIKKPSKPSSLAAWHQPDAVASVIPGGAVPAEILGIATKSWVEAPKSTTDWAFAATENTIDEPEFKVPSGYKRAAGVVVLEQDGRVWAVAPSNAFGGYQATFPKGTVETGMSLQATALVEAFEESGLRVRLLRHLVDVKRSLSYTRYYLAVRVGGNPADMGWETQAVMLVPQSQLANVLTHTNDAPILAALAQMV